MYKVEMILVNKVPVYVVKGPEGIQSSWPTMADASEVARDLNEWADSVKSNNNKELDNDNI